MSWCSMILPGNGRIKRFQEGFRVSTWFPAESLRFFGILRWRWRKWKSLILTSLVWRDVWEPWGNQRKIGINLLRENPLRCTNPEMIFIRPRFSYVDQYWFSHAMNCKFCIKSAQAKAKNSGCVPRTWFWSTECCWNRRPICLFDVIWGFVVRLKISGNGGRGDQQAL